MARLRAVVADAGTDGDDGTTWRSRGDIDRAFARAAAIVESRYEAPFLAHAALEPPNATAWFRDGRLAVWAPTQAPGLARRAAAASSGLPVEQVALEPTLIGGGFGRRLEVDVVRHAARIAVAVPGRPVQALWSREEDMAHDAYRPAQAAAISAALDAGGRILGWRMRSAGDSVTAGWLARNVFDAGRTLPDKSSVEGLIDQAYEVDAQHVAHVTVASPIPVGNWRGVGHSFNAFFLESFIDELAVSAGADPLRFRLALLAGAPRHRAVLELAAARGGWHEPASAGRARGIAIHESYGTIVAMIADVGLDGDGSARVHRVACAIDCGTVINPGIVAQQVEGSVVFALSAALHGRIDVERGRVVQRNFPSYRLLSLAETPRVDTYIVSSARPPAGVGEPAVPPVAPAVGNALFALTGRRLRSLPLGVA
jgi:isoquinoline 1-oxidoreductase beta subunit